jgi:hypothetical protein
VSGHLCTCGYVAADCGDLADHWGEAFIPADDADPAGMRHAEAAREPFPRPGPGGTRGPAAGIDGSDERAEPAAFACLCGAAFDHPGRLDAHLLEAFIPAGRIGLDGLAHAPAA